MNQLLKHCKDDPFHYVRWINKNNKYQTLVYNNGFKISKSSLKILSPIVSPERDKIAYYNNQSVNILNLQTLNDDLVLTTNLKHNTIEGISEVKYRWDNNNVLMVALTENQKTTFIKYEKSKVQKLFTRKLALPYHIEVQGNKIVTAEVNYDKKKTNLCVGTQLITLNGAQQHLQPTFSPNGKKIAMIYDESSLPVGINSLYDLWVININSMKLVKWTSKFKWRKVLWLSNTSLVGIRAYGPFNQLYIIGKKGIKQLTDEYFSIEDFDVLIESGRIVYTGVDIFGKVHTKELRNHSIDAPFSKNSISFRKVTWNGPFKNMIGLLIFPNNFNLNKKYPLIVDVHGGGPGASMHLTGSVLRYCSDEWGLWITKFEAIVFVPEFRASGVYDDQVFKGDFISGSIQDIESGVDYLIERGMVKKTKMVVIGGSYGALISNMIPVVSKRYKAIISVEGWIKHDLPIDPLLFKATTPMLFIQGNTKLGGHETDQDIHQYHRKLLSDGVRSEYLYVANEGHVFYKKINIQKIFQKIFQWLDTYLK